MSALGLSHYDGNGKTTVGEHCEVKRGKKHNVVGRLVIIILSSLRVNQKLRTMTLFQRLSPMPGLAPGPGGSCLSLSLVVAVAVVSQYRCRHHHYHHSDIVAVVPRWLASSYS